MSDSARRRPMRLQIDADEIEPQPWRVRLTNGQERGPVGFSALKSLTEVGLLTAKSSIASVGQSDWQPIAEHPLWNKLNVDRTGAAYVATRTADSVPPMATVTLSPAETPVSAAVMDRMAVVRHQAFERTLSSLRFWRLGRFFRAAREALVFCGFLTVGDLLSSFFSPALNVAKWACLLCLIVLALGYYTFRALEK